MEVKEVKEEVLKLQNEITTLIFNFEKRTETRVENVTMTHFAAMGSNPNTSYVEVKVSL